jgi:hypothetical protein
VWANLLFLRPGTREHFLEHLARDWPEELERYQLLYARGAYIRGEEAKAARAHVNELRRHYGVADRRAVKLEPTAREAEQLALAV